MKTTSIKKNAIYNFIRTFASLAFPAISFMYASRILLPTGIGKINFSKNMIQYFVMFAGLGTSVYGIREGVKYRDDKSMLSRFTQEILFINAIAILISYFIFIICLFNIPQFNKYKELLLINSFSIIFVPMGVEWFYSAIENYSYITIRSVIFQIISFVLMVVFVKHISDIYIYACIMILSSVGSNILNLLNLRKYIFIKPVGHYEIKKHIKPVLIFFASVVSSSIYLVLDTSMLGFMGNDIQVGLYSAANKMTRITISVVVSFGTVLLPRMTYYASNKKMEEYNHMIDKAFHVTMLIALPVFIIMFCYSKEILVIFSGESFSAANMTARILSFIVLLIPFSTLLSNMIFLPKGKEKYQLVATLVGAVTNITVNYYLIPVYEDKGAAIGTFISEASVLIVCIILGNRTLGHAIKFTSFWKCIIASITMLVLVLLVNYLIEYPFISIVLSVIIGCIAYGIVLIATKDRFFLEILVWFGKKIRLRIPYQG